jgi:hypothetical protein
MIMCIICSNINKKVNKTLYLFPGMSKAVLRLLYLDDSYIQFEFEVHLHERFASPFSISKIAFHPHPKSHH